MTDTKNALEAFDIICERIGGYQTAKDTVRKSLTEVDDLRTQLEANAAHIGDLLDVNEENIRLKAELAALKHPTPQNREADMPDERETAYLNIHLWLQQALSHSASGAYQHMHDKVATALHHLPIIKPSLRADLANKPALDAEVLSAIEAVEFCIATAANPRIDDKDAAIWSCGTSSKPRITLAVLKTLIRAASAVQELKEEIDFLRRFGNKECTHMADQALAKYRETGEE